MSRALDLARRGTGSVHPNPLVGAVVVRKGRILAEGWHARFGGPHAEIVALSRLKSIPRDSILYVTLEPCAHHGKTPPCVSALISRGIKTVVVAAKDPDPRVNGKGFRALRRAGVQVVEGVLRQEAEKLNCDFAHWTRTRLPYVVIKAAQTLDGKIATRTGQSRWITGRVARAAGHRLRAGSDAILVGVNTVLKDDPLLSARGVHTHRQPLKVILDGQLRVSPRARVFSRISPGPVLIACTRQAPSARKKALRKKAEVLELPSRAGRVDLKALLRHLGKRGVVRLLVEGGAETISSFLTLKLAHEAFFFVAPKILGGRTALASVGGLGPVSVRQALRLKHFTFEKIGEDLLIRGRF